MIDVIIFYTLNKIRVTFLLHYVNFCFKFELKLKMTRRRGVTIFKFQYMNHTEQNKNSQIFTPFGFSRTICPNSTIKYKTRKPMVQVRKWTRPGRPNIQNGVW